MKSSRLLFKDFRNRVNKAKIIGLSNPVSSQIAVKALLALINLKTFEAGSQI
jgi:hypothetical protein